MARDSEGSSQLRRDDSLGDSSSKSECGVISDVDKNYLTPIDVVVKNEENNVACIRARFALSIKVEEAFQLSASQSAEKSAPTRQGPDESTAGSSEVRAILGYLPLENVLKVENTCPAEPGADTSGPATTMTAPEQQAKSEQQTNVKYTNTTSGNASQQASLDELEMIVTFECGKLAFTFKKDDKRYFMSSIKGLVKLGELTMSGRNLNNYLSIGHPLTGQSILQTDSKVKREFIVNRPMFLTSDLTHRFKYDDLIEVGSEAQTRAYILTANFYFTEIELFRKTASRDFTRPPDDGSKPFSNDI